MTTSPRSMMKIGVFGGMVLGGLGLIRSDALSATAAQASKTVAAPGTARVVLSQPLARPFEFEAFDLQTKAAALSCCVDAANASQWLRLKLFPAALDELPLESPAGMKSQAARLVLTLADIPKNSRETHPELKGPRFEDIHEAVQRLQAYMVDDPGFARALHTFAGQVGSVDIVALQGALDNLYEIRGQHAADSPPPVHGDAVMSRSVMEIRQGRDKKPYGTVDIEATTQTSGERLALRFPHNLRPIQISVTRAGFQVPVNFVRTQPILDDAGAWLMVLEMAGRLLPGNIAVRSLFESEYPLTTVLGPGRERLLRAFPHLLGSTIPEEGDWKMSHEWPEGEDVQ